MLLQTLTKYLWYEEKSVERFDLTAVVVPQHHDVPVGTETGQAHAVAHGHHVGPQDKRRLRDVVHEEARLRRHQENFGLPLRAHHGQVSLSAGVLGGRGGEVDQFAPPRSIRVLGGVLVPPNLVGALNESSRAVQEREAQHRTLQHLDSSWGRLEEKERKILKQKESKKMLFVSTENIEKTGNK